MQSPTTELGHEERSQLLELARAAVVAEASGGPRPRVPRGGALDEPAAAFVSLHRQGDLRGCLGCLTPRDPSLAACVARLARAAACEDPRFPRVAPHELAALRIEISVIGPMRRVSRADDVVVGRDGLVVSHQGCSGVLLPQVAAERGWSATRFLEETCRKARLAPSAWREGADVEAFTAVVFGEVR